MNLQQLTVAGPDEALVPGRGPDQRVLEHVTMKAWDRLLFVECGDGWFVEEAWRRLGKGRVCGLSTSPQLVDLAIRLRGVPSRVEFKRWEGERFPLINESFDRVISCVPCGSYHEPAAVLREVARVLRPDGDAYLVESDGSTQEVPPGPCGPALEQLLVEAGFGDVQWNRCDTAPSGSRDGTVPVLVHARRCSPAIRARRPPA